MSFSHPKFLMLFNKQKQEKNCEGGKSANKRQNEVRLEGIIAQDA